MCKLDTLGATSRNNIPLLFLGLAAPPSSDLLLLQLTAACPAPVSSLTDSLRPLSAIILRWGHTTEWHVGSFAQRNMSVGHSVVLLHSHLTGWLHFCIRQRTWPSLKAQHESAHDHQSGCGRFPPPPHRTPLSPWEGFPSGVLVCLSLFRVQFQATIQ